MKAKNCYLIGKCCTGVSPVGGPGGQDGGVGRVQTRGLTLTWLADVVQGRVQVVALGVEMAGVGMAEVGAATLKWTKQNKSKYYIYTL